MTRIEFPVKFWQRIRRAWLGDAYMDEFFGTAREQHSEVQATPDRRVPDREGYDRVNDIRLDPDNETKVWEWDVDLDAGEQAEWDAMFAAVTAGGDGSVPSFAAIEAMVSTMSAYRDSTPGTTTPAQMDATLRAIIDYIRYLEARV